MKLLITGALGFIGRNLALHAARLPGHEVLAFDVESSDAELEEHLRVADAVVHLAGVNRPTDPAAFETGNVGLTERICARLAALGRPIPIVFASSTQAALDNPYGRSKRAAEEVVRAHAARLSSSVAIFRLPGVFGKWCRPNYNSVVATFCHNVAHLRPLQVDDPDRQIDIVYIDDAVGALLGAVSVPLVGVSCPAVRPVFTTSLGKLAETIQGFRDGRTTLELPEVGDPFVKRLYTTYLSYVPADGFAYDLFQRADPRGTLAELAKGRSFGQMFVSRTLPGITRGNHYHDTKVEKFIVVEGEAIIRFRHVTTGERTEYPVDGRDFRVVDIPPGWAHSIQNVGTTELVVLFWANEGFDPARPDTYAAEVL